MYMLLCISYISAPMIHAIFLPLLHLTRPPSIHLNRMAADRLIHTTSLFRYSWTVERLLNFFGGDLPV